MGVTAARGTEGARWTTFAVGRNTIYFAGRPPLTHVASLGIKNDDAMIAIAVRDIDVASLSADRPSRRIDCDIGWFVECSMACIRIIGFIA